MISGVHNFQPACAYIKPSFEHSAAIGHLYKRSKGEALVGTNLCASPFPVAIPRGRKRPIEEPPFADSWLTSTQRYHRKNTTCSRSDFLDSRQQPPRTGISLLVKSRGRSVRVGPVQWSNGGMAGIFFETGI
jgi:hypothetical protein